MKTSLKSLQLQIIAFPILLIVFISFIYTYLEQEAIEDSIEDNIQKMSLKYIELNKNNIKNSILRINKYVKYQLKNTNKPIDEIKRDFINKYSEIIPYENYLFIYDLHDIYGGENFATMILNQNNPEIVDTYRSDDEKDLKGKEFYKEVLKKLRTDGEAYVEYWYKRPNSDGISRKMSYFFYQKDLNWIIAKGFYFKTLEDNIQSFRQESKEYIKEKRVSIFIVSSILLVIVGIISFLLSKKIINLIHKYVDEINRYKNKMKKLINTQDNIIMLTDGYDISFANQKFFDFFGLETLEEFNKKYKSFCEVFIENDRFFHRGKLQSGENWLDAIDSLLMHSKKIVTMLAHDFTIHAFSVTINNYDDNYKIVSFTNISQTMLEQIKLEDKTIKDKLTGAFNREYFEKTYEKVINESKNTNYSIGFAILDIDYFKKVNDTYGHDVGDSVLKQFVKTIQKYSRDEDILIRWGGEEFVLILKVKESSDLEKALEHIRKVIELQDFDTVGKKTCSIGGTIYKIDEEIDITFKRADEAVYEAKANGRNQVIIKLP